MRGRPAVPLVTLLLCLTASVGSADGLGAQGGGPLLDRGHWVRPVLQRLDALGALPVALDPASDGWTRPTAVRALEEVAGSGGEAARIARFALLRLRRELPVPNREPSDSHGAITALPHWLGAAWAGADGDVLASFDTSASDPSVAAEERSRRAGGVTGRTGAGVGGWLWAEVVPMVDDGGGLSVETAHVLATRGVVGLWAGRRTALLGPLAGQPGLVLGEAVALPGIGAALLEGVVLPGPLALLGPISASMTIGRLDQAGPTEDPWVWLFRGSARPHPRLRIGLERAALIGGRGSDMSAGDILLLLVGKHGEGSGVDNQIVALDAWYRVPVGVPLALYGSLGADDSAGAWRDVPARQLGLELAAVPGVPALAVAVEHTAFSGSCCGNPPWYRHLRLPWLDVRSPLGHPLGGHGREWRVRGRLDARGPGVWATADVYTRDRGAENLSAPLRMGRSIGGGVAGSVRRPTAPVELLAAAALETAGSWTEWRLQSVVRWWF